MLAPAIALDAAAVAKVPVLGYEVDDGSPPETPERTGVTPPRQPWIACEHGRVTIDVGLFAVRAPFDALLVDGSTTSKPVSSLDAALSDFGTRWDLPAQLPEHTGHLPITDPLHVGGTTIEALVWPDGMVIGVDEPFAAAMRLLIAGFSVEAFSTYNSAAPAMLKQTLALLPNEVTARHIPEASRRVAAAHEIAWTRQRNLPQGHRPRLI